MYKLLAASALSVALLTGTAIAQVNLDGSADGGVSVDVGGTGVDVGGGASGGASADDGSVSGSGDLKLKADAESDELDTDTTASVGADADVNAVLEGFGDEADGFFADEARTELKSEAEIKAAFDALTPEQQQQLIEACGDASGSADATADDSSASASGSASICSSI